MKSRVRIGRFLFILGTAMTAFAPTAAFAHDNLGGDELAVANWMLIGAVVVALIGALAMVWGFSSGQFNNIEESKYTMLDTAEDFDAIMAEADAAESKRKQQEERQAQPSEAKSPVEGTVEAAPKKMEINHPARV